MSTLVSNKIPRVRDVRVTDDTLTVDLEDGRSISAPIAWYPRLQHGSAAERHTWSTSAVGQGIHWPLLDEDLSVEGILAGRRSAEGAPSFERWLQARSKSQESAT